MNIAINISVVLLVSLTIVTVFAIVYYIIFGVIFKKSEIAKSMGHVVATGTIIVAMCILVFSAYMREQSTLSYDNGYSAALDDISTISENYVSSPFSTYLLQFYVEKNYADDATLVSLVLEAKDYINASKNALYFTTDTNPDIIKKLASTIRG